MWWLWRIFQYRSVVRQNDFYHSCFCRNKWDLDLYLDSPAEDFDQFETEDDEEEYVNMKAKRENGSVDIDDKFDSYFEK